METFRRSILYTQHVRVQADDRTRAIQTGQGCQYVIRLGPSTQQSHAIQTSFEKFIDTVYRFKEYKQNKTK